jgi:hypothetical protein
MRSSLTALVALAIVIAAPLRAQERFSFFRASTPANVHRMLTLANLQDDDVVVDLGSGDGLIPRTAARMNPKLRGRGVEIDPALVEASNRLAASEGVADRVRFDHRNAFDADLGDATVVTMGLFPELMYLLRPIILERARPGTRVLTATWALGSWQPDQVSPEDATIQMWIVPARVGGAWRWNLRIGGRQVRYAALVEQRFQVVEGMARAGDRREVLTAMKLRGADVSFGLEITVDGVGLTTHTFTGRVQGNRIQGTVKIEAPDRPEITLPWRADRVAPSESGYFGYTGTALFQPPGAIPFPSTHR